MSLLPLHSPPLLHPRPQDHHRVNEDRPGLSTVLRELQNVPREVPAAGLGGGQLRHPVAHLDVPIDEVPSREIRAGGAG